MGRKGDVWEVAMVWEKAKARAGGAGFAEGR